MIQNIGIVAGMLQMRDKVASRRSGESWKWMPCALPPRVCFRTPRTCRAEGKLQVIIEVIESKL